LGPIALARFMKLPQQLGDIFHWIDRWLALHLLARCLGIKRAPDLVEVDLNASQSLFDRCCRATAAGGRRFDLRKDLHPGLRVRDDGRNAMIQPRFRKRGFRIAR
jgi:hypothetical protein